jgi:diamine N-acetyltransferase
MLLENEKIKLRAVEPEDLDILYRWENNPDYWHAGELRMPHSKFALKQYILSSGQNIYESKQLRFMIESKTQNKTVGTIDLFDFDAFNSRVGVGLLIDEPHRGNGLAEGSLKLIEEFVFSYLKINQLYAHVAETNETSGKLFERCGFKKACILKDWISVENGFSDVALFQLFR